jgi:nucleoside-diphosphate-sugar epimerase
LSEKFNINGMNMKILVTGATGFVGAHLVNYLYNKKDVVVVAVGRRENQQLSVPITTVDDFFDFSQWKDILDGVDVIVHVAAKAHDFSKDGEGKKDEYRRINVDAPLSLADFAYKSGVKRFIFLSSIGVHGAVDDGFPISIHSNCKPHTPYALSKLEAEEKLSSYSNKVGIELVVIRPPLIYGAHAPGNFKKLVGLVEKLPVLPFGAVHNRRSFVSIDNLVSLIWVCANSPQAANKKFLVSDDEDISTTELIAYIKKGLDSSALLLPVPISLLKALFCFLGLKSLSQSLLESLRLDITYTRKTLNWSPDSRVEKSIKKAVNLCRRTAKT